MDWYVIQAYSGYEQKVKAALEERIALNNLCLLYTSDAADEE